MPEELGDMKKSMERKRNKEQYKRLIKLSFAAVMLLGLCFLYGVTWIGYYNKHILQIPFYRRGNWLIAVSYTHLDVYKRQPLYNDKSNQSDPLKNLRKCSRCV